MNSEMKIYLKRIPQATDWIRSINANVVNELEDGTTILCYICSSNKNKQNKLYIGPRLLQKYQGEWLSMSGDLPETIADWRIGVYAVVSALPANIRYDLNILCLVFGEP